MGWPNATPENVHEIDQTLLRLAQWRYEALRHPDVQKARRLATERQQRREKAAEGSYSEAQAPMQRGHLVDASFDAPGQPGDPDVGGEPGEEGAPAGEGEVF